MMNLEIENIDLAIKFQRAIAVNRWIFSTSPLAKIRAEEKPLAKEVMDLAEKTQERSSINDSFYSICSFDKIGTEVKPLPKESKIEVTDGNRVTARLRSHESAFWMTSKVLADCGVKEDDK